MNIFDKKLSQSQAPKLPINPIELYQTCSYKPHFGYLRGIQEEVLNEWHKIRNQKDIMCKMNTGSGKTLTGLLMLYSKMVEINEPSVYLCPDKQLVEQTLKLSDSYGIPTCAFDIGSSFPIDFLNSKKILICTFHRLFNGKSKFNTQQISLGSLLVDDAHKCVDIARENTTLKLDRGHDVSKKILSFFEETLKQQQLGTFERLKTGDPSVVMKVPYWSWITSQEQIIQSLNKYYLEEEEKDEKESIFFKWDFIAENITSYDCFISGHHIEISPIHVPYHFIRSYKEAKHRFILSATFEDDHDLIKDLGISLESVLKPIIPKDRKDVGKRLIIAPSRFDTNLKETELRDFVTEYSRLKKNIIVLVSSNEKSKTWQQKGAELITKENIDKKIEQLHESENNFFVFSNRYDGLDLNNDLCRVLVIDGIPKYTSLKEQYEEVRIESLKFAKKAQIIEQGLGRGVRSGADYCLVYLIGDDLISFLGREKNLLYFTPITRVQLKLGLELLDDENTDDSFQTIRETANACLTQNDKWIQYHNQAISAVSSDKIEGSKVLRLNIAEAEKKALAYFQKRQYLNASNIILKNIVDEIELDTKEKAWYFQLAAQLAYPENKVTSNDLQIKASELTTLMFHPINGYSYNKIYSKDTQSSKVKSVLDEFSTTQDILIHVNESVLKYLKYNPNISSDHFELSLKRLGELIGFTSQMPEKETGKGPDCLWCMSDGHYLILEAKSRAIHDKISKDNIGQLLTSEVWFKTQYGESASYTSVTLQKTSIKEKNVDISSTIKVIDQHSLTKLRENILGFANALQSFSSKSFKEEDIKKFLVNYELTPKLFLDKYIKKIIHS